MIPVKELKAMNAEELHQIVQNVVKNKESIGLRFNGHTVELDLDFGNKFSIFDTDTYRGFYSLSEDEVVDTIMNYDKAVKSQQDADDKFARQALPTLWKQFKSGKWMDGQYVDDFFSDYYKDVFSHRPRTEPQIAYELTSLANQLGVKLTENLKEEFDLETQKRILFKASDCKCRLTHDDFAEADTGDENSVDTFLSDMQSIYDIICKEFGKNEFKFWRYSDDGILIYFADNTKKEFDVDFEHSKLQEID